MPLLSQDVLLSHFGLDPAGTPIPKPSRTPEPDPKDSTTYERIVSPRPSRGGMRVSRSSGGVTKERWDELYADILRLQSEGLKKGQIVRRLGISEYHVTALLDGRHWSRR